MADSESASNTGVVAILVIFLVAIALLFFAWQGGIFGGGGGDKDINIKVDTPASK